MVRCEQIMPVLHRYTLDPENKAETLEQLDKQLMEPQIVATTCLSINECVFASWPFLQAVANKTFQSHLHPAPV